MNFLLKTANKLLEIDCESFKINLLLLPPIYGLWLLAIGQFIIKNKKLRLMLSFFTFLFTLVITIWLILLTYLILNKNLTFNLEFINWLVIPYWIVIVIIYTYLTLTFESKNSKIIKFRKLSIFDFYIRFFLLSNWIIGIWSLQRIFSTYKTIK
jgi:hypothetical protein